MVPPARNGGTPGHLVRSMPGDEDQRGGLAKLARFGGGVLFEALAHGNILRAHGLDKNNGVRMSPVCRRPLAEHIRDVRQWSEMGTR